MASSKRIGFLWGEEKITLVEYQKGSPLQVYSSPLGSKSNFASPFSSNLTEDVQITALLQKMLKDNRILGRTLYVSMPMKEIILRSFVIPFVNQEDIQNAIKFEAKKYLPIDIQDLTFVFYSIPFTENKAKRLQIIFFAVRRELLERYEHIFNQVNAVVAYCEPSMVSLTKVLLSKKEITTQENVAFLILDKALGRICFIDRGIPQFIREFYVSSQSAPEEVHESPESLNLKIVNEVGNSFDFYLRQFNGDRIENMLVSGDDFGQDLFDALETELKIKLKKVASISTAGESGQSNDLDAIYAMGACIDPPIPSLAGINFLEQKKSKSQFTGNYLEFLNAYKEIIFILVMCVIVLVGLNIFFKVQLKVAQTRYDQMTSQEGKYKFITADMLQSDITDANTKLAGYKAIRSKSDVVSILITVASHIPKGAMIKDMSISYTQAAAGTAGTPDSVVISVNLHGNVVGGDANDQLVVVNQIYADLKNDKDLAQFVKNVNLVSLTNTDRGSDFNISCN